MGFAFSESGFGHADEMGIFLQLRDGASVAIAHAGLQSASQLKNDVGNSSFIWD